MKKQRHRKNIAQLAEEILSQLHEIDQKVDHLIRRLPRNGYLHHSPQWNHSGD
jgi:hypothetical protein